MTDAEMAPLLPIVELALDHAIIALLAELRRRDVTSGYADDATLASLARTAGRVEAARHIDKLVDRTITAIADTHDGGDLWRHLRADPNAFSHAVRIALGLHVNGVERLRAADHGRDPSQPHNVPYPAGLARTIVDWLTDRNGGELKESFDGMTVRDYRALLDELKEILIAGKIPPNWNQR